MTAKDHLMNMIGESFSLWMEGKLIADGILKFDHIFRIEDIGFESDMVFRITDGRNIHLKN